jgi:SMODS and SLOG-associating 2TM effector domain 3/SMODS and SLOG-associating 2TM effector domain 1
MPGFDLTHDDLPRIFIDADQASQDAQRKYRNLLKADIALVLIAALLGAFSPQRADVRVLLAYSIAGAFTGSLVVSFWLANRRYERIWYGGRALAESVKTLSWRFTMGAEPYNTADGESRARFISDLEQILMRKADVATYSARNTPTSGTQITKAMLRLRASPRQERLEAYLTGRIDHQQSWYRRRASQSRKLEERWFAALVVVQALGILAGLALVSWPQSPINGSGVCSALAAAIVAWVQISRHQELAQSYAIAENDLALVRESASAIQTDDDLSLYISDAENAISREHTLWLARRDT